MAKLDEDSPAVSLSATSVASSVKITLSATKGSTTRLALIVGPGMQPTLAPEGVLGVGMSVNDTHASFLQGDGKVVTLDVPSFMLTKQQPATPSPGIASRALSVATLGMLGPKRTSSHVKVVDFGKSVAIRQINSYGARTMAVDEQGNLYQYDENLSPVQVVPKYLDGRTAQLDSKIVEVHPGGSFYVTKSEDASLHQFCKLTRFDPVGNADGVTIVVAHSPPSCTLADYDNVEMKEKAMPEGRINIPRGRVVVSISCGEEHCALVALNTNARNSQDNKAKSLCLYTVGKNSDGQLGLGRTVPNKSVWTEVKSGLKKENLVDVSASDKHTLALNQHGKLCFFGKYANTEAYKPHSLGDDEYPFQFASIAAANNYAVGLVTTPGHDDVAMILHEGGHVQQVEMLDNSTIVKVHKMSAGRNFSLLDVEAAKTPTTSDGDDGELDSTSNRP